MRLEESLLSLKVSITFAVRRLPLVICLMMLTLAVFSSCEEEKHYYVKNIDDGNATPSMRTLDVLTSISDSGYTKYLIKAPIWDMYEESTNPYWSFPDGVELEQYDTLQHIEATVRCDSAKYLTHQRLWQLDGRVVMVNVQGDSFLTNQLFWDEAQRNIYSDSFIHIVRKKDIIEGYGFTSNERMTSFTVHQPTGIFPVPDQEEQSSEPVEDEDSPLYDRDYQRRSHSPVRASERPVNQGVYTSSGYHPITTLTPLEK